MDTQFYLSFGALEHLTKRKSLFNASAQVTKRQSKQGQTNSDLNGDNHNNHNQTHALTSSSSTSLVKSSTENVTFRFVNNNNKNSTKPIVHVTEVQCFQGLSADDVRYGVKLFDGLGELSCTLDPSMYHMLPSRSQDQHKTTSAANEVACITNGANLHLMCGSVILLNEYKLVDLCDLLTSDELEATDTDQRDIPVVCLVDFILLGHSTVRSEVSTNVVDVVDDHLTLTSTSITKLTCHETITTTTATTCHTNKIAELDNTYSKTEWSIKCKLVNRTMIREFENRQNGAKGHVCRFLLLDTSGLIELVAFNKFCFDNQIKQMKINCFYLIKNGDLKATPKQTLKAWPDQLSVQYEIQCTLQTKIVELVDQSETDLIFNLTETNLMANVSNYDCQAYSEKGTPTKPTNSSKFEHDVNILSCHRQPCQLYTTTSTTTPPPQQQKQQQIFTGNSLANLAHVTSTASTTTTTMNGTTILHEKFTPFNLLFCKRPKSFVDIIGIVCAINTCETTKISKSNAELSLRKVQLVDKTNISVNAAFWGKQAEQFDHKVGTCLMINKVQVTNYNGLSLSVLRMTEIMEVKRDYNIEKATELIDWWQSTTSGK